ncbi:hypothetical protein L1987_72249 [Smallanthus sonchifolius]|uniref:Uncharacterized protein n=1 Tax=Smallanthus sonchifolius TaxID=185202 RepID=A0ACB9AW11_9ASTR|nr:hypothetical protein L1987_72249 [Smallanthus sonchifolius]
MDSSTIIYHQQSYEDLIRSYLGISFAVFLGFLPKQSLSLIPSLQAHNESLSKKLLQAEEQLEQLYSRRKEDSKANARVVEIFSSHRHSWQQEEKRLLRQIDDNVQEIANLRAKVEDLEIRVGELKREGVQYESVEPVHDLKHYVTRRESPWKVDGHSSGVSAKLKLLEQELQVLENTGANDLLKVPSLMKKQAKRYQALAGKIDDLCRRMEDDPCEPNAGLEHRTQRQTEFLLEALRLQQRASETGQKLVALQTETGAGCNYGNDLVEGHARLTTRLSLNSIRNNFRDIQRNLEIWLARIIGDVEGTLSRDASADTL